MGVRAKLAPLIERVTVLFVQLDSRHLADYGATHSPCDLTQVKFIGCSIACDYTRNDVWRGDCASLGRSRRAAQSWFGDSTAPSTTLHKSSAHKSAGDRQRHDSNVRPSSVRPELRARRNCDGRHRIDDNGGERSFPAPSRRRIMVCGQARPFGSQVDVAEFILVTLMCGRIREFGTMHSRQVTTLDAAAAMLYQTSEISCQIRSPMKPHKKPPHKMVGSQPRKLKLR